jgi:hypothetical protein
MKISVPSLLALSAALLPSLSFAAPMPFSPTPAPRLISAEASVCASVNLDVLASVRVGLGLVKTNIGLGLGADICVCVDAVAGEIFPSVSLMHILRIFGGIVLTSPFLAFPLPDLLSRYEPIVSAAALLNVNVEALVIAKVSLLWTSFFPQIACRLIMLSHPPLCQILAAAPVIPANAISTRSCSIECNQGYTKNGNSCRVINVGPSCRSPLDQLGY